MSENQDSTNDELEIRNLIENWAGAVRRKDLVGVLRNHSPSILMFDVPLPLTLSGHESLTVPAFVLH